MVCHCATAVCLTVSAEYMLMLAVVAQCPFYKLVLFRTTRRSCAMSSRAPMPRPPQTARSRTCLRTCPHSTGPQACSAHPPLSAGCGVS